MQRILSIAINDLRVFLKDPSSLIFTLLVPIGMTFFIGLANSGAFGGGTSYLRVDVIDHDQSALSGEFLDDVRAANASLVLCPMDNDDDDICGLGDDPQIDATRAESRVQDTATLALIEIPAGFEAAVQAFEPVQIRYVSNEDLTAPGYIETAVNAALLRINGAVVAAQVGVSVGESAAILPDDASRSQFQQAIYEDAAQIWADNPVRVTYETSLDTVAEPSEGQTSGLQAGLMQSVPGMGAMFVMFTVFGGMTAMTVERKQRTLARLVVMPVSRAELLGGKILGRFMLGMLQFIVVFVFGLIMGVNFGSDPLAVLLLIIFFTLAITALSFTLGNRMANEAQANGLSLLLSIVLASLGGAWWPLEIVPEFMRIIGHISPVAWVMDGFNSLVFTSGGLGDVLVPLGVLAAMAVVFFTIGVLTFTYE